MNISRAMCGGLALTVFTFVSLAFSQTFEYDDLGRLKKVVTQVGDQIEYQYDAAGNRTQTILTDKIPSRAVGPNLISLTNWPVDSAPAGAAVVSDWGASVSFSNEARWTRVNGPGNTSTITAMEAGQTESDANGGGASKTNNFTIDPTKGYEFTIYFKKYDQAYQSIYLGTRTAGVVKYATNTNVHNNPYFVILTPSVQSADLEEDKWYKIVAYVLPEGYPLAQSYSEWGGIFDVDSGEKVRNVSSFRWYEDRATDNMYARFFVYYGESEQNRYTTYFYRPSVRVTDITYTPVVPGLSITPHNALEGEDLSYEIVLSEATTVDVKVDYEVAAGTASADEFTATSGTLVIPEGQTSGTITVATAEDSVYEASETVVLTLTNPVRATRSEINDSASITNDDTAPSFSISNATVLEGGTLTFTVTKSGSTALSHNVNYATAYGSAIYTDFTYTSGTLSFTAGQTSKTVSVITTQESINEHSETLYVNLSSATNGATISDSQGVGTITNDDNVAPVANNDSVTAIQASQVTVNVVSNDTDANGDSLTVTSVSADYCTIYSSTSLDCSAGPTGTRTFTYTISDGFGGTDTGTVTLTVTGGGGGPLD
ncbi:Calx-beta domain-containing protein [Emcibacter nanhaiensis]|uniref:Calx-beta domain-containing protein n=1 Tax=Emcibacter nanhaiensis TaxID=1505037 RepID=A0A501PG55_9PROT|nr:Calx-beta domain-containing protein [Emcibacter nanhaiensis]TPD58982.1 hypothetical protein FIV46_12155 [Emcibacter nanhaiensis]